MTTTLPERPRVSVVVPMLDEADFIEACLDGFSAQTYPLELLEVIAVDGGSTDGSRQLVRARAVVEPWIRMVDNPRRKASAAFNVGVGAATGDVLCLFSAHGIPGPAYVDHAVHVLRETGAQGVGGRYLHEGIDPISNAVGLAMVSRFGMASPHRFASKRCAADTISHPAYLRQALLEVGPFDEDLERNSDYELNFRMRAAGMTLIFDPSVVSVYRPRGSIGALARQFWWYGRWKERVIRRHPASLRARHLAAPVAVAGALLTPLALAFPGGRRVVSTCATAYAALLGAAVAVAKPRRHGASSAAMAACFPVMHAAWGAGFLASAAEDATLGRRWS